MSAAQEKKLAGYKAAELVEDGMTIGLGTGSTAEQFVRAVGEKVANGLNVRGVPTSEATAALAQQLNIPLVTLEEARRLDITVDGADEADPQLRLIKGGGGALLREKIVAAASDQMIVITDASKLVDPLGGFDLPVEIVPFGAGITADKIKAGIAAFSSLDEVPVNFRKQKDSTDLFVTDGGHYIVDCAMTMITDVEGLADYLSKVPGIVDHGLFIGLASKIIVGRGDTTELIEG